MKRLLAALLATSSLAACAMHGSATADGTGGGKADGSSTTITFAADFTQAADGAIVAGDSIRIAYDLDRLTACRGESDGSDQWGVTGWAQFDAGAPQAFAVSQIRSGTTQPVTASLAIPRTAKHLQLWFSESNVYGCNAYDSDDSANYQFDVTHGAAPSGATLAFDSDGGAPTVTGTVRVGGDLVVHYDPSRLATCEAETGGRAAWSVTGHYQVDGGAVHDVAVTQAAGPDLVAADPTLSAPHGHDLAWWFDATSVYGCHAYDSANGANYHVTIAN